MNKASYYKGCLEPILLRLLGTHGRMYGYEITQRVKELTRGELNITEGALYPLLHRLEAEGILDVELEYSGARIRKYYRLTRVGKKRTSVITEELKSFLQNMESLVYPPKLT